MNNDTLNKFLYLINEHKLKNFFRLCVFLFLLIPFVCLAVFNITSADKKLTEKAFLHKIHEGTMVSAVIKERLDSFMALGTSLSQRPFLRKYMEEKKYKLATTVLEDVTGTFTDIERVVLYDTKGVIIGEHPVLGVIGTHRRDMKWYKDFEKNQQALLTNVYARKASPPYNVVSAILPMRSLKTNQVVGILMLQVKLEHFYNWIKTYNLEKNKEFVIILDQEGKVVFHPTLNLQERIHDYSAHPFINKLKTEKNGAAVIYNPWDKEERLASYRLIEKYNWSVFISEPTSSVFLERNLELKKQIITTVLSFLFFITIISSGFVIVVKNKKIAQQLKEKEEAVLANKAKSEFVSNISHEIRTPLNAILGYADYLTETTKEEETKAFLHKINKAGENLLSLINNILELSKIESGITTLELKPTLLYTLIMDTVEMVRDRAIKKGLDLKVTLNDDIKNSYIITDQLKLQRVILNITNNAVKFTSKGEILLNAYKKKNKSNAIDLIIEIKDQGIGIAPNKIPLLFKRFSQVDSSSAKCFEGSGLGLSICTEIINLMGGTIKVKSKKNQGSTFTIVIPFIETNEALPQKEPEKRPPNFCNKKIHLLLADDSEENRTLIQVYLKSFPYHIDMATNGKEAITKFKSNTYNIVFMDMQMPEVDGFEATKTIRKWEKENKRRKTPIIALTGFALKEDQDRCYASGCSLHVAKPIKREDLLKLITNYILQDEESPSS